MDAQLHPDALDALVKRIRRFFELANAEEAKGSTGAEVRVFAYKGRGIRLTSESNAAFEKLVDALVKHHVLREHIPRKTLSQRLMNALLESNNTDSIEDLVTNVVAALVSDVKPYYAYIPIGGITLEPGANM